MGTLASHPNIITVHGSGFTERGQPYILMEFTPNGALADRLEQGEPLPWSEVLEIGVKMAGALETAHRSGVLHRDVKPENILVSTYGEPQLADFGIARLQGSEETKTDTLTASIAHVSPELLAGDRPSALSDVYALGSTLFMLLTGSPAFIHDTDQSIVPALTRITAEPVPDLRGAGVPARVCDVIERLMAKDTGERLPTAEAAGRALQGSQRQLGQPVTAVTIVGEPQRIVDLDDGATNTISPEALAALPGIDTGAAQSIAADAGIVAGVRSGTVTGTVGGMTSPPATEPGPPAPAPHAASATAATSAARSRRTPVAVGVAVVALLAIVGGAVALLGGPAALPLATVATDDIDPADAEDSQPSGVTDADADAASAPLTVDRSQLRSVRLEPGDLAGSWTLDADLERQARALVPALLCSGTPLPAAPVEVVAYRSGSPGPRIAQSLRTFAAGEAAIFMASLHDEVSCLERLGGVEGVRAELLELGDEAMRISYSRPGSSLTLGVALVFERVGDVVSQVIHLDYPRVDDALTEDLIERTDEKLAELHS